ncbi:FTR1 family protein [soil metagenome]
MVYLCASFKRKHRLVIESFIILFRESFEAALIVGIILGYLKRTGTAGQIKTVAYGVIAALLVSLAVGVAFKALAVGFEGANEEIFEGVTMLATAALLSTLIVYMIRVKPSVKQIETETGESLFQGSSWGLFLLVFVSIFREGLETVLFLIGLDVSGTDGIIGSLLGLVVGVGLVYLLFRGLVHLNFKVLFNVTNALLILIAAGLVAHGMRELQSAEVITSLTSDVWDINPQVNADGSYPALHDKGVVGGTLSGIFGYNGDPSILEVLSYLAYILVIFAASKMGMAKKGKTAMA